MEYEFGDYEEGKELDPMKLTEGDMVFLSNDNSPKNKFFFIFKGATDNLPLKAFQPDKAKFKSFNEAYKHFKGESESVGLLFEDHDDKQAKLVYNKNNNKWGRNPMSPSTVQEAVLTKQGKYKINKDKIGKYKDFLDL